MDIGIITIVDNNNYGNRLQNYATQEFLEELGFSAKTLVNYPRLNQNQNWLKYIIKRTFLVRNKLDKQSLRYKNFMEFNKNISFDKKVITCKNTCKFNHYDYFLVGSDQVWNSQFGGLRDIDLLSFAEHKKKVSFSASFGIGSLQQLNIDTKHVANLLLDFKSISVREHSGKKIIETLTGRKDISVLVDPTMLISQQKWSNIATKPSNLKTDKYILNYFLGEVTDEYRVAIENVAKMHGCELIYIMDSNSEYYSCGPKEFLYLEENAFMVCTDSFHSSVFAIIFDTPFLVFNRVEKNVLSMNTRLDTLLSTFELQDRKFSGSIIKELLTCDYYNAKKIMEKEREKSILFLQEALDI